MHLAVIDYNAGNIRSVLHAMERIGVEADLTRDPEIIQSADKVIFPGVGEAASTMAYLQELQLDRLICDLKQPVLGICLGMQLLCEHSEERDTPCLGIIPQRVVKFEPKLKVPHMGWNQILNLKGPLFSPELEQGYVYFVHSYYAEVGPYTIGTTDYIVPFSSAVQKDNFYATQFHPEKSGSVGEQILKNFLHL